MSKWYEKTGPEGDIVISTRIRLARNLLKFPFPCKLLDSQRSQIADEVRNFVDNQLISKFGSFRCVDIVPNDKSLALSYVERHLISPEFIEGKACNCFILSLDESISVMINEEDHIRLQVMGQGFSLDECYQTADALDTVLDEHFGFAFDEKLGYLTQCPTNLGTGMRASVMLHLPALEQNGLMGKISESLLKLGLTIRGMYGEGSNSKGCIYQLSNQVTLGLSEMAAIKNLKDIALQLIAQERTLRADMAKNINVVDKVSRSVGILRNAVIINNDEFMKLISNVRFGLSVGILHGISYDTINALIIDVKPATIMRNFGEDLSAAQRDQKRAVIVKERLGT